MNRGLDELLVNITPQEVRVAGLENGVLRELLVERFHERSVVGNIYRGKVVRVLPGMQAAFVDIGLPKAAFLYAGDVDTGLKDFVSYFDRQVHGNGEDAPVEIARPPIESLLSEGQEISVQVTKAPLGTKGARITTHITLPGRFLVYMPTLEHIGVSRRIESEEERGRLTGLIEGMRQEDEKGGWIVRTLADGASEAELARDRAFLLRLWKDVHPRLNDAAPSMIHEDLDLQLRALRDIVEPGIERLQVDSKESYDRLRTFSRRYMPEFATKLQHYAGDRPIFDLHGVEEAIKRALSRKVPLKSGGYLVIDETEALTAIDINTGRYVGRTSLEETAFKTNLEASQEIVNQLRLRNLGGIIVIDFIDMQDEGNRERLVENFREALRADRARTNILNISKLGLIEMTRKRTRRSLTGTLCEPCPACSGRGMIKTLETVAFEILRDVLRTSRQFSAEKLMVVANPEVIDYLESECRESMAGLESFMDKPILLREDVSMLREEFDVVLV
ncbi:MAG: ribonuclease G [Alphaproteobacteria bacterium CG_4_10_14_0_2_um_filter_63_37]|nr:MAG: ribonuclease E/G [Proteobacteria bacterium CG1_02_64_396]PJA25006.1 MAG: ribonuclease G [Alphaproteobacteria bacterium CG_4_10_14_0_2_um_filter_63_37]